MSLNPFLGALVARRYQDLVTFYGFLNVRIFVFVANMSRDQKFSIETQSYCLKSLFLCLLWWVGSGTLPSQLSIFESFSQFSIENQRKKWQIWRVKNLRWRVSYCRVPWFSLVSAWQRFSVFQKSRGADWRKWGARQPPQRPPLAPEWPQAWFRRIWQELFRCSEFSSTEIEVTLSDIKWIFSFGVFWWFLVIFGDF